MNNNTTSKIPMIYIVGNSRSGTTLISRILSRHQDVYVLNETHFYDSHWDIRKNFYLYEKDDLIKIINQMLTIERKGIYRKSEYEEYPKDAEEIYQNYNKLNVHDYSSFIMVFMKTVAIRNNKIIPGDQTPRHIFVINELLNLNENSKFIHMIRDPRAISLSQKNKWKASLRSKQPKFEVWRTRINYHPITMSLLWNKVIDAGNRARLMHGYGCIKSVKFEELTSNPENCVRDVCTFLGLKFNKNMLDVDVSMSSNTGNVVKGINSSVANKWVEGLTSTEIRIVEFICGSRMKKIGYENSGVNLNPFTLVFYLVLWPVHIGVALLFNLGRMGNPVNYLKKRIFD